jgi:hypothetical protein
MNIWSSTVRTGIPPTAGAVIDVLDIDEAARRLGREIPDVVEDANRSPATPARRRARFSAATGLPAALLVALVGSVVLDELLE